MGYKKKYKLCVISNKSPIDFYLQIDTFKFYVPRNFFAPNELEHIWSEVFVQPEQNPHSYVSDFVKMQANDVVIDAGACEGFFIHFSLENKCSKVIALEPEPNLAKCLEKTFDSDSRVEVHNLALSDNVGTAKMVLGNEYGCTAKLSGEGNMNVKTTTLDQLSSKLKLEKIDWIKMDIEDKEVEALKGAIQTINRYRPKLSIAVYHSYENARAIKELIHSNIADYQVSFGGCFLYEEPARPFMLYAKSVL